MIICWLCLIGLTGFAKADTASGQHACVSNTDTPAEITVAACQRELAVAPSDAALSLSLSEALLRAGRIDEAIAQYSSLVRTGNLEAMYRLAILSMNAQPERRDVARSLALLNRAAMAGHASAQHALGVQLYLGQNMPRDYRAAAQWFTKAADQGSAWGQYSLGYMLLHGLGVQKDPLRAAKLLRLASDQNDTDAMRLLASMYGSGARGLPRDPLKQYIWLRKAAENGNSAALLQLSDLSQDVLLLPIPQSNSETETTPESSDDIIAADELLAANRQVVLEATGRSSAARLAEAAAWLEKAIAKNVPDALLRMGNLNLGADPPAYRPSSLEDLDANSGATQASGFRPSAGQAAIYYEKAADKGSNAARLNLARMLELGHGVSRNIEAARRLYQEVQQGPLEPQARLGLLRLASADVWSAIEHRQGQLRHAIDEAEQVVSGRDIVIKPRERWSNVLVMDVLGRRYFGGVLPSNGYHVPPAAQHLIVWPSFSKALSTQIRIEVGGREAQLPASEGFGIELDPEALLSGVAVQVPVADYGIYPDQVPEQTRQASRITLIGLDGQSDVHVATGDELVGFSAGVGPGDRFFVPDMAGLALDMQAGSDGATGRLAVVVDGRKLFELTVAKGCAIHLALVADRLLTARSTNGTASSCEHLAEHDTIRLVTARDSVLGTISKAPDESIPGAIAGFAGLNRGIALLKMRIGGRWDQLLQASRIVSEMDRREYGPNSLAALTNSVNLSEAEAAMGNLKAAQALLDGAVNKLETASYLPDDLRSEVYFRTGSFRLQLGRYGEAEQFLSLAAVYRLRYNERSGQPPYSGITRIYDALADTSMRLHRLDEAIAYNQRSFLLSAEPERSEAFPAEISPSSVIQMVKWLKLSGRSGDADGLLEYLHREAKREFARDLPEPLAFPLDLSVFEATFGPVDRSTTLATAMANLAQVYEWMGRSNEAIPVLEQQERTLGNLFGENSPQATASRARVADEQRQAGRLEDAVVTARQAWNGAETYASTREAVRQEETTAPTVSMKPAGMALLEALYAYDPEGGAAEAFGVSQRLHSSSTALAMQSFADRLAVENDDARVFLRQRQDLAEQLVALDRKLAIAMARTDSGGRVMETTVREDIYSAEQEVLELNRRRPAEVKALDELARVPVMPAGEIGPLLSPNELLITYAVFDEACFAWTVDSSGGVRWFRLPLTGMALERAVAVLRNGLGPGLSSRGAKPLTHPRATEASTELAAAHDLYMALLHPMKEVVANKESLTIVADGVLTSLPFHALVSEQPDPAAPNPWRAARWLVRDHAISLMPSVSSLRSLSQTRQHAGMQTAYLGIAAPIFDADGSDLPTEPILASNAAFVRAGATRAGVSDYFRGGFADIGKLRQLSQLPDSATEVRDVANSLTTQGSSQLLLGKDASEKVIKSLQLDRFRIIHFATHGLVSGDVEGLAEPALALTPPTVAGEIDDGLLTASEIARLHLNASWVILSACNTAGGERPEAEALSGLARSFFYAGARSVLVSHWPVVSSAAVKLTTGVFSDMAENPTLSRAEALRRSMLALIDGGDPSQANPSYWAPFIIVGDGGRY
ncbi:CHAT domain-containing protein [Mesorhizobium sp. ES1-1]|uniref:CHAT domain-containing protein n=1 Tax=Mesorhizobium sp. ES1-1 TaxID=2876629 RepID=UPI001CCCA482|nr:CHAT domain-containing protein [Mesorhizobium sp. ES1-1]MBZ9677249.1 CHAT domain-containing protein [Mesorhizobium sp. ES1-1]